MKTGEIEEKIRGSLRDADVEVTNIHHPDEKSEGEHYEIKVVSPEFNDKNTVERHREIHKILGDSLGDEIHAVEITALTKEEA